MDTLIAQSLLRRGLVVAATILLLIWGSMVLREMPVDVLPDLTAPNIAILTETRGMAPVEVEQLVTRPIEISLHGISGLRRLRSSSWMGISIVWADFDWNTNLRLARQRITERLTTLTDALPPNVDRPILTPETSVMGEIVFLGLTSPHLDPDALRELAEIQVRRRLLAIPGISQVSLLGGIERQYQVILDPARLFSRDIGLDQVIEALRRSNQNVSAGILEEGGSEWMVVVEGRITRLTDLAQVAVDHRDGVPIRIQDLGEVRFGGAPRRGTASLNGEPAVLLGIQKEPGANTLQLTRELDTVLDRIEQEFSHQMNLNRHVFRQSNFIQIAVGNVQRALLEGVILVVLVVLFFLVNPKATVISVLAIPISLMVAVLTLHLTGATINTMTLGGMAIAIGALVDDAVIDVENVVRRLRLQAAGDPMAESAFLKKAVRSLAPGTADAVTSATVPLRVVYAASVEIRQSIVFANWIIGLVFVPVFFLSGVEGRLLQPLGVAYLAAIAASLLVAVTLTPALCLYLLPGSRAILEPHEFAWLRGLRRLYSQTLTHALRHPVLWLAPALLISLMILATLPFAGRSFLPEFNEGALTLHAATLPGTTLDESNILGRRVEEKLMELPEVVSVARRTGRAERDEHVLGVESAEIDVVFQLIDRRKDEFLAALRHSLEAIPGVNITVGQPISHRIDHILSGTRAGIAIKIFGSDQRQLRRLGSRILEASEPIAGVADAQMESQADVPMLRIVHNRDVQAHHGLSMGTVAAAVESTVGGARVGRVFEGSLILDLVVRTRLEEPASAAVLEDLLIDSPFGYRVPLQELAQVIQDLGPNQINREELQRKLVVSCNTAGRDVGSVVADIRRVVDPILAKEPGYRVEYGGQFESAEAANRRLLAVSVVVLFGIAGLLRMAFGSWRDTALILVNLPLAVVGGVVGLWVSGGVLSVASMIGFITVFGIAARNGILMVAHIRNLQLFEDVTSLYEAVHRGACERLVPILMTALASGFALVPLALSGDRPGNEIQSPMAIVILFGLLSSMTLNGFLVPTLYLRFGKSLTPHHSPERPPEDPSPKSL